MNKTPKFSHAFLRSNMCKHHKNYYNSGWNHNFRKLKVIIYAFIDTVETTLHTSSIVFCQFTNWICYIYTVGQERGSIVRNLLWWPTGKSWRWAHKVRTTCISSMPRNIYLFENSYEESYKNNIIFLLWVHTKNLLSYSFHLNGYIDCHKQSSFSLLRTINDDHSPVCLQRNGRDCTNDKSYPILYSIHIDEVMGIVRQLNGKIITLMCPPSTSTIPNRMGNVTPITFDALWLAEMFE